MTAEPVQLQQVLSNLIMNAVDVMSSVEGRERRLTIKSESNDALSVRIAVEDSNNGINPSHLDRIFDPFFTTKSHGMGIGLSVCRSIVESHGGQGKVLDGAAKYDLHFDKDKMLPSNSGVWSVSPYRENFYVRNAIDRYGILSSMPLKYNADGSLDIYIQTANPGADWEANWLPCPPSLPFNVTIRVPLKRVG